LIEQSTEVRTRIIRIYTYRATVFDPALSVLPKDNDMEHTSRKYVTITEAASCLAVDPRTIRNHLAELGGYKKLGRWFVASDLLEQHLPPGNDNDPRQMELDLGHQP
jgi:hypothetical protein